MFLGDFSCYNKLIWFVFTVLLIFTLIYTENEQTMCVRVMVIKREAE